MKTTSKTKSTSRRRSRPKRRQPLNQNTLVLLVWETLLLIGMAAIGTIMVIGNAAALWGGLGLFQNILPFAFSLVALLIISSVCFLAWLKLRTYILAELPIMRPILLVVMTASLSWLANQASLQLAFGHFRGLVGGKQEASRVTLAHQVYAAYRRQSPAQLMQLVARAQPYQPAIKAAAADFKLDIHLLQGIAAAESSFLPRTSQDGGHGLFQITRVPEAVIATASRKLGIAKLSWDEPTHNSYLAAATLQYYLADMRDDLFLGLLAYNIGSKNGGLRFIMQSYGVTDFVTIQPYLQKLPGDYPIRVLTYALAFRLWDRLGQMPAYAEAQNALKIQRIGIPGL